MDMGTRLVLVVNPTLDISKNGLENGLGKSINQDGIITYEGFWKDGIPIK